MYVSRTFAIAKKSVLCVEYPSNEIKIPFIQMENIFSQFIDKFFKIEEVEYVVHYVKFNMWPAVFYVNFLFPHYFLMSVLGCTLFPPIYTGIENWDFKCCPRLVFPIFPIDERDKKLEFLD